METILPARPSPSQSSLPSMLRTLTTPPGAPWTKPSPEGRKRAVGPQLVESPSRSSTPSVSFRLEDAELALRDLKGIVVLDEVQRRPDLFSTLRYLADRPRKPARFLVLGSASPDLLRQASESLAGRIAHHVLPGFTLELPPTCRAVKRKFSSPADGGVRGVPGRHLPRGTRRREFPAPPDGRRPQSRSPGPR